jgi:pyruvate,water dikinase
MLNVGEPHRAFSFSFLPNDGVGLAREEFIINNSIKIHPLALINFDKLTDKKAKAAIAALTVGYASKPRYFVDKLAHGVGQLAAAFYPKDVIVRLSDFKTNEYAGLIGGRQFEPKEDNPMIGWRGASRYYAPEYEAAFRLECKALKKVREEYGLKNLKIMVPFCRTVEEGEQVLKIMASEGLRRGKDGLEVYVMCEIPANVILAHEFARIFDGFSIGSNDLTQLTLGIDRDSGILKVAGVSNEKNEAVKTLIRQVIQTAKAAGRKIGICGQGPSDFPDFAEFLVKAGIDSLSLNPDSVLVTTLHIIKLEKTLGRAGAALNQKAKKLSAK